MVDEQYWWFLCWFFRLCWNAPAFWVTSTSDCAKESSNHFHLNWGKESMRRLTSLGIFLRSGRRSLVAVLCVSMFILMIYIFIQHSSDKSPRSSGNVSIDIAPRASPKLGMSPKAPKKKDGEKLTQADLLIYQPAANTTVLRALLLFYPNDQENDFVYELRWFFRSWIEMMTAEPPLWRTDLIVYASEYSTIFKELGCVLDQVRLNATEPTQCRVFPYVRIKNRNSKHDPSSRHQVIDQKRSEALYQHLRGYGYIDSINTVLEYNNSYSMYNYVLRTDMDCFLTLNFARYVPYDDSLIVGRGGYSTEFNQKRLRRIARDMGWSHAGQTALGSTWSVLSFHTGMSYTTSIAILIEPFQVWTSFDDLSYCEFHDSRHVTSLDQWILHTGKRTTTGRDGLCRSFCFTRSPYHWFLLAVAWMALRRSPAVRWSSSDQSPDWRRTIRCRSCEWVARPRCDVTRPKRHQEKPSLTSPLLAWRWTFLQVCI